jgi:hypothetical protein
MIKMEWVVVAVLSSGVMTTDLTFDTAEDCMSETGKIAATAYKAAAWEQGPDLVLPQYACLLLDD